MDGEMDWQMMDQRFVDESQMDGWMIVDTGIGGGLMNV